VPILRIGKAALDDYAPLRQLGLGGFYVSE